MKPIHYLYIIAALCLAACHQQKQEQKHQVESIPELLDSLMNRGEQVYRSIYSSSDSTYFDEYWFHYFFDDSIQNGKESTRLFLTDNMTELLDKLCQKAEQSYRYCTKDSLNYSITMNSEPMELMSYKRFRDEEHHEHIGFTQTNMRPAKYSQDAYDAEPIHALLQKFLAEQKSVKSYDVHYEWDEGVPFPPRDSGDVEFIWRSGEHGPDSLAASMAEGTLYLITMKGEDCINSLAADFSDRLIKMITEQPIKGVQISAFVFPGKKPEERAYRLQGLFIFDGKTRRRIYELPMFVCGEELYILELNTADVPRYAIPLNWWTITRSHNTKVFYRDENERYGGGYPCYDPK